MNIPQDAAQSVQMGVGDLAQLALARLPLLVVALFLFVLAIIIGKIIQKKVENKLAEHGMEDDHKGLQVLGGRMAYLITVIIGLTVALKVAGVDLTAIIAAGAFGIGFALKDMIMNFLAGIMLLVGRHFKIGDFIAVGEGTIGRVVEVQSRVTVLQATDGTKLIVPNAQLLSNMVKSYTSNPFRRISVLIGIDYKANLENAIRVAMDTAKKTKGVLAEPQPTVLVREFTDNGINLRVRVWVESRAGWVQIKSALTLNLRKAMAEYGISFPSNVRVIAYEKDQAVKEKMFEEPAAA